MDALAEIEMDALRPIHAGELVGDEGHWSQNACLAVMDDASALYIDGYYLAALRIVENLGHDQDFLVYPAVFLFRQYLELRLKDLIEMGEELGPGPSRDVPATHDLRRLWAQTEAHLRREYKDDSESATFLADLRAGRKLVERFADLDPTSTTFRYCKKQPGQTGLPRDLPRLNLGQFAAAMSKLAHFLDCASYGMGAEVELKQDFEREYSGEY